MHNHEHLIGSAQSAKTLGIDRATFNRWVAAGKIKPVLSFPGKRGARLFSPEDVERLRDEANDTAVSA